MKNFYRNNIFIVTLVVLVITVMASLAVIYTSNISAFYYIAPPAFISCVYLLTKSLLLRYNANQYYDHIRHKLDLTIKTSLYKIPGPVVIINEEKKVIWYNEPFSKNVCEGESFGVSLNEISDEPIEKLSADNGCEICYNDKFFQVHAYVPDDHEFKDFYILYFNDITEYKKLVNLHKLSKPIVMIIVIDNYEDLFANNRESQKAEILMQIDHALEEFIINTSGFLRKTSADRFFAVVEERDINKMIDEKFPILENVRKITARDRVNATISIGVGRTAKTMMEGEVYAKQAIDMALGRGGDQAVIKTQTGYEFFGGVSKGIERQTKVRSRIIATAMIELFEASDHVFVMGHKFGDLDSIGAAIGLSAAILKTGTQANAVFDTEKNLAGALLKRYSECGGDEELLISPQRALELATEKSLLIIVDTHNPKFVDSIDLLKKIRNRIVIDHHRKMVEHIDNAVIFYHEPYASSASEMVAELIQYFGKNAKLTAIEAEGLLAGIMLDTKNFVMKTGVRTFEAAAYLRKMGADTVSVRKLFSSSIESYQVKAKLITSAEIYRKCAITAAAENDVNDLQIISAQTADELLGISGVDASFVLFVAGDGISISARSMGAMNVQLIMEQMGGGGHLNMAGTQLSGANIESARQTLLEAIDTYYNNQTHK